MLTYRRCLRHLVKNPPGRWPSVWAYVGSDNDEVLAVKVPSSQHELC